MAMMNEAMSSFKDEAFGTVFIREEVYASIEDEEKCFNWLRETGNQDLIKQTIHSKTLASTAKDHDLNIPGVKTTVKTKIGIRRS